MSAVQVRRGQWSDYNRAIAARKKAGVTIGYLKVMSVDKTTDPWSLITAPAAGVGPFFVCGTNEKLTHSQGPDDRHPNLHSRGGVE